MRQASFVTLNLSGFVARHIPYLVWQELFNLYRAGGGNLDRMSNILIDLDIIKDLLQRDNPVVFYWSFYDDYTILVDKEDIENWLWKFDNEPFYKVAIEGHELKIWICTND